MILPSKHLREDRCLLRLGGEILARLDAPKTVSRLWHEMAKARGTEREASALTYDWFILALDLLCIAGVVKLDRGRIRKVHR